MNNQLLTFRTLDGKISSVFVITGARACFWMTRTM
jgi:hypothetical protein